MKKSRIKKGLIALVAAAALVAGIAPTADAIVNGTEVVPGNRTYQVSLQNAEGHFCGGTVIDATTVITAAHCLEGEGAGLTVRAGLTDLTSNEGQTVPVATFVSHPEYQTSGLADIAVVTLATPLTLGSGVTAIPLATADEVAGATTGVVSGWGAVSENGEGSSTLLETSVPLVSDSSCQASVGADAQTEVCAGGTGTDSCYGDSGGPLVVTTARGTALAGVVSWGDECGGATPGVYADVPGLTSWINQSVGGSAATTAATDASSESDDASFSDGSDQVDGAGPDADLDSAGFCDGLDDGWEYSDFADDDDWDDWQFDFELDDEFLDDDSWDDDDWDDADFADEFLDDGTCIDWELDGDFVDADWYDEVS